MEEQIVFEDPRELVVGENSRFRADDNQDELMESIKQHGILQPIVARTEDKVIICGNRRLSAALKLNLATIPVRYKAKVSDKELLILNLLENMQRKDISSIEIGKQCDTMLRDARFRLSISELAVSLGVNSNRIKACLEAFRRLPEKYRKNIVHITTSHTRKEGDLPENVVFAILNFGREFRKLTDVEMDKFFRIAKDEKLSITQVRLLGKLVMRGMSFANAVKQLDNYHICRLNFVALKTEMASVMKTEGINSQEALFTQIVKKQYPNLLY